MNNYPIAYDQPLYLDGRYKFEPNTQNNSLELKARHNWN